MILPTPNDTPGDPVTQAALERARHLAAALELEGAHLERSAARLRRHLGGASRDVLVAELVAIQATIGRARGVLGALASAAAP